MYPGVPSGVCNFPSPLGPLSPTAKPKSANLKT